jgi:hypothetical protein
MILVENDTVNLTTEPEIFKKLFWIPSISTGFSDSIIISGKRI